MEDEKPLKKKKRSLIPILAVASLLVIGYVSYTEVWPNIKARQKCVSKEKSERIKKEVQVCDKFLDSLKEAGIEVYNKEAPAIIEARDSLLILLKK